FAISCSTTEESGIYGDWGFPSESAYGEKYKEYDENPFLEVKENPISTFSVDADGAAYANMRRYVNLGQLPPKQSVRIEEFINYFTFNYPEPTDDESISLNSEVATCPWNTEHLLMRVGIKGKTIEEQQLPPSNYVFLIDVSGSMDSPDKIGILKAGFKTMVDNIRNEDKIAIVTYAGNAGVLLDSTPGSEKDKIKEAIDKLNARGTTAGYEGLSTAYRIAKESYIKDGNNRIILGSDGDFNAGPSSVEALVELVESKRDEGIFITVLGVGGGNLNDHMAEQIANKGNGNYEYIDSAEEIEKIFVHERSKFYTIAKDTKIQLTFNPEKVKSYRLIGYENRLLNNEDFEDDKKDAGEIGVGQTITAMYEIVPEISQDENTPISFADFDVRYKKTNDNNSRLVSEKIVYDKAIEINQSGEDIRFATSVTAFGLILRDSEYKGTANKQMILELAEGAVSFDPQGYRKKFIELVKKIK
ncbi:MAG: VWA domain-containing protein, partial [Prevotella sp.]|nr:VWA domain-containing protein [Prevotella sp.]